MNVNKLWFPWKPTQFRLGTISEDVCLAVHNQCAKFHVCIKKCTICLKFRVMPPDYKYQTCSNLYLFDYLLMVGSTRIEQCPAFAETPAFSTS